MRGKEGTGALRFLFPLAIRAFTAFLYVFPLPRPHPGPLPSRERGKEGNGHIEFSLSPGNQSGYFSGHFCMCFLYLTLTPALSRQGRGGRRGNGHIEFSLSPGGRGGG